MPGNPVRLFSGERATLATMHGKERVIAPLSARFLGLRVAPATGLDTDVFGTFTRDVSRMASPLDTARLKIAAAFYLEPGVDIGMASEGSFGPHPHIPFLPLQREFVVLLDRRPGLELIGHHVTSDTNFSHRVVTDIESGRAFAKAVGFPDHGVAVLGCRDAAPAPEIALFKDLADDRMLVAALADTIRKCGAAFVETDMRAHRNPRRMRAIKRAMIDLVDRSRSRCPSCEAPGYGVTGRLAGLPCSSCRTPTDLIRAETLSCAACGYRVDRPSPRTAAEPACCPVCNP